MREACDEGRGEVTRLLSAWAGGDDRALRSLGPLVYDDLRGIAKSRLQGEPDAGLQTTALVHEAWLRLADVDAREFEGRVHFFALASTLIRRILVDHARSARSRKRGGDRVRVPFDESMTRNGRLDPLDLLALDEALSRLAGHDSRLERLVVYRFFGGMTMGDAAAALGVSVSTAERDWVRAKAYLYDALRTEQPRRETAGPGPGVPSGPGVGHGPAAPPSASIPGNRSRAGRSGGGTPRRCRTVRRVPGERCRGRLRSSTGGAVRGAGGPTASPRSRRRAGGALATRATRRARGNGQRVPCGSGRRCLASARRHQADPPWTRHGERSGAVRGRAADPLLPRPPGYRPLPGRRHDGRRSSLPGHGVRRRPPDPGVLRYGRPFGGPASPTLLRGSSRGPGCSPAARGTS